MGKDTSNTQINQNIMEISLMINHMDMECSNIKINTILETSKMEP